MTLHTLTTDDEPNGYDEHTEMIGQARGQVRSSPWCGDGLGR